MRLNTKTLFYLARRILIEERYLALKNSASFMSRTARVRNKGSYIMRFVNISYGATSLSFMIFSLILVAPSLISHEIYTLSSVVLLLFIYSLFINISNSLLFFVSVNINHILDPLRLLPVDFPDHVIAVSWFIYTGSSSLFAVLPAVFLSAFLLNSIYILIVGAIWSLFSILLGYVIGSSLFVAFGSRISGRRTRVSSILRNAGRVIFLIFVFAIFEIILYNANLVNGVIPKLPYPYSYFVPVFNIQSSLFFFHSFYSHLTGYFISISYTLLIGLSFVYMNRRAFYRLIEPASRSYGKAYAQTRTRVRSRPFSFFSKDLKISSRKSQNLILLIMPIFFVFPTIMSEVLYAPTTRVDPVTLYNAMVAFVIVTASFYSILFLVIEGNGISFIKSLPLDGNSIIRWKIAAPTFIFLLIDVSMLITISIKVLMGTQYYLFIMVDTALYFVSSIIYNMHRLYGKIPDTADTVNFYSFGGQIAFISTFAFTGIIVGSADIFSLAVQYSMKLDAYSFFAINTLIGFITLAFFTIRYGILPMRTEAESMMNSDT
ncbi:permease [Thermoplasma sp. Kam2015]|uniref:permease n=1 Tax=Thermoplasma sp. Kam2015 TaxID=2094122 RepID=UPI001F27F363|nr:permease [Thermoplasma sp. Kam2015]